MNHKVIQDITILGSKHLHNHLSPSQSNAGHSHCLAAGNFAANESELAYKDELAMIVEWISQLPRQYVQFLIEELGVTDTLSSSQPSSNHESLTGRENEVLILVASGYSRVEIGNTLNISPNTAATHITNIYRKLDISSVAEATKYAIAEGLLSI